MTITKKDYEAIADIINSEYSLNYYDNHKFDIIKSIELKLSKYFEQTNILFDKTKFKKACEINTNLA